MTMLLLNAACLLAAAGLCALSSRRCNLRIDPFRPDVAGIVLACACTVLIMREQTLESAVVLAICAVAAVTDLQTGYILDGVVFPGAAVLVPIALEHHTLQSYGLGALIAAGVPLLLFIATRGAGIGLGDVKLGGCIGALGAAAAFRAIETAFIAGGCIAAVLLVLRGSRMRHVRMPFAPFLLAGVTFALLFPGGK